MINYSTQLEQYFDALKFQFSDAKPSAWSEAHRVMSSSESRWEGPFSYNLTPYCREIVDELGPDSPTRLIGVKKGAQDGFSKGVLENIICYYISEHPCNILHLTGHADLAEEGVENIDLAIDGCGLRSLIRDPRITSRKSGDTTKRKLFPGGKYISGSVTNHKLLAQRSIAVALIDDYSKGAQSSKASGSTRKLIEQRLASFGDTGKMCFISTPEVKPDNIEEIFLLGDQRYYNVPCPCCGAMIPLKWNIEIANTDGKEHGGISWKVNEMGKLIENTVGYICQECSNFFTDENKYEMNLAGVWMPTCEPSRPLIKTYQISSLYAPIGMYSWTHYVRDYIDANPKSGQIEHLQKTLVNLCWGEVFEQQGKTPKGNDLQKNIRRYEIGTVPESLSVKDGNGKIILLTCAADMNGTTEDARLDYEIVAWSETGSSYSIQHGSIGTFIPRENSMKVKIDRDHWTYDFNKANSVWPEFTRILSQPYNTDTGRKIGISYTGLDSGHAYKESGDNTPYSNIAYTFVDSTNLNVTCVKGKDIDKFIIYQKDVQSFHYAKERSKLFLVEVNYLKDQLAQRMLLKWKDGDEYQPAGFMNFPQPGNGLYGWGNFFEHYESEKWVEEKKADGTTVFCWKKKTSASQNHMWDCAVYNMVIRDIFVSETMDLYKIKNAVWADFVKLIRAASGI